MPRRKYQARPGGPLTNQQARLLGSEIESMEKDGLPVTPTNVVQRAKSRTSKIHKMFNWKDKEAAHRWRIDQARSYLASLVTIEITSSKPKKELFNITVRPDKGHKTRREYVRKEVVLFDDTAKMQLSGRMYKQLATIADQADQIGLTSHATWAAIVETIRSNDPGQAIDRAAV